MPKNVRNFWIELTVDGRKTKIATGPRSKDGGFSMDILMRNKGSIVTGAKIEGFVSKDGYCILNLMDWESDIKHTEMYKR